MNIMKRPTILGIVAMLFGVVCMAHAGLEHGGGFGLAAGIMGLAAGYAGSRKND